MGQNRGKGRPEKYNTRRVNIILKALNEGITQRAAAQLAGISRVTLQRWLQHHDDFREKVEATKAKREQYLVSLVEEYALKDWRAASFLLKARHAGWSDSKTSQENRDLMDRLKIMEQALTVKLQAMRVQQASMSTDDYDIVEILNEVHGIEEKLNGEGLQLERELEEESEGSSSEGIEATPGEEEGKTLH